MEETDNLLETWFGATRGDQDSIPSRMAWWFGANQERDRHLADRFGGDCEAAIAGVRPEPGPEAHAWLAEILLLDQLPRNIFRGTARAFAGDARALALTREGHRRGLEREMLPIERVFFWMPLQHAESLEAQELGVRLFTSLATTKAPHADVWRGFADYARRHHDLVARFGRFPHRNQALGRASTSAERAYLEAGGDTFGQ